MMTGERTVQVLRPDSTYVGKQGLTYALGVTGQTAGARGICLTAATMPPGARARAHYHDGIDTVGYIVSGESLILFGEQLEQALAARSGDYFFIPGGMPHAPCNVSDAPCTFVVAHSASDDQEGIVMRPELDAVPATVSN
jgi:uncharacterized RmlC-like cupin family protein